MRTYDKQSEEELNEQRKVEQELKENPDSVVGAVERTVDRLIRPLVARPPDPEDLEEQREENDEEQRPE